MSFLHNFFLNNKEKRHYMIKFREIILVSICFNYIFLICKK